MKAFFLILLLVNSFKSLSCGVYNVNSQAISDIFKQSLKTAEVYRVEDVEKPRPTPLLSERTKLANLIYAGWENWESEHYACFISDMYHERFDPTGGYDGLIEIYSMPQIKLVLASVLIQANNKRLIELDRDSIRNYIIEVRSKKHFNTKRSVLIALGTLGDIRDVEYLNSVASKDDGKGYAEIAKVALSIHKSVSDYIERTRN
ncbi:hypothetical protein [Pseudoalteromonas viridis]|uniref:HEAT repeat domain-containing protein n=1 Tax=Pseudoalteromonas viridis TaxID=339617 RepID=A0ABX7V9J5_9GAMM|nr:hypothetical protein [Pseudoalteromonas viridis]QTL37583.1 hypothetical protein J5X90_22340 [Pseudoalteromonas viridis]